MIAPHKQYQIVILFLSSLLFIPIDAEYPSPKMIVNVGHQTHSRDITSNISHHDFSHTSTWDNSNINKGFTHRHCFSGYTTQDFQQHFTAR